MLSVRCVQAGLMKGGTTMFSMWEDEPKMMTSSQSL